YRISWDGSVSDEPGFVAFGGQADQVAAALKERFSDGMSLTEALGAALAALAAPAAASGANASNGSQPELTAANLEVAILDRARAHRTFRRLQGPRLEELITESRAAGAAETAAAEAEAEAEEPQEPSSDDPPTGPSSAGDGIPK
ncbi:MAG TPA: proteasome subunit alpha, partial [Trebonia sp.]|nr:proteasome subunit alpha [Trebonia sp.]